MKNKLMILEDLQELDLKSDGSQARIQDTLSEIEALDGRLEEVRSFVAAKTSEIETTETERTTLEESLAAENANIVRSEANLKSITTQKEYQAVNKEIASAKKLIVELEEQILQKISRLEELKIELSAKENELEELDRNLGVQKDELRARIAQEEASVASDARLRAERAGAIPPALLNRYQKLRETRKGIAVVEARDGGCLGCNMHIPPQMYNNLYRGEDLITCPHCQRILILRQEPQAQ